MAEDVSNPVLCARGCEFSLAPCSDQMVPWSLEFVCPSFNFLNSFAGVSDLKITTTQFYCLVYGWVKPHSQAPTNPVSQVEHPCGLGWSRLSLPRSPVLLDVNTVMGSRTPDHLRSAACTALLLRGNKAEQTYELLKGCLAEKDNEGKAKKTQTSNKFHNSYRLKNFQCFRLLLKIPALDLPNTS